MIVKPHDIANKVNLVSYSYFGAIIIIIAKVHENNSYSSTGHNHIFDTDSCS
jgi:hypothetical protein